MSKRASWAFHIIYDSTALVVLYFWLGWTASAFYLGWSLLFILVGLWIRHRRALFPKGTRVEVNYRHLMPDLRALDDDVQSYLDLGVTREELAQVDREVWMRSWILGEYLGVTPGWLIKTHHHVKVVNDPLAMFGAGHVLTLDNDDYIVPKGVD